MMIASEDKKAKGDDVTMRMLAPTLHYDFQLVIESEGALESFRAIRAEVLLLGGSTSPAFLKVALDALEKAFPPAKPIESPGTGHRGTGNTNSNTNSSGQPDRAATDLRPLLA